MNLLIEPGAGAILSNGVRLQTYARNVFGGLVASVIDVKSVNSIISSASKGLYDGFALITLNLLIL